MKDYQPSISFGPNEAKAYRDIQRGDEAAAVDFLQQLAGQGPALELGIGTGRIALQLVAKGVTVDGCRRSRSCHHDSREPVRANAAIVFPLPLC